MNIHATSDVPRKCASFLDDKRVNKMFTETVQMLCTVWWYFEHPVFTKNSRKYRIQLKQLKEKYGIMMPTHINHPCLKWAAECKANYGWLTAYAYCLYYEYCKRFGKTEHKSMESLRNLLKLNPYDKFSPNCETTMTSFPNCARHSKLGIDYTYIKNTHEAYKMYLMHRWKLDKNPPKWSIK